MTELRFERWYLLLSVPIGLGPKNSEVSVTDPDALIAATTAGHV